LSIRVVKSAGFIFTGSLPFGSAAGPAGAAATATPTPDVASTTAAALITWFLVRIMRLFYPSHMRDP